MVKKIKLMLNKNIKRNDIDEHDEQNKLNGTCHFENDENDEFIYYKWYNRADVANRFGYYSREYHNEANPDFIPGPSEKPEKYEENYYNSSSYDDGYSDGYDDGDEDNQNEIYAVEHIELNDLD